MLHVAHYADDLTLHRPARRREGRHDVLAYRIACREEFLRQRLVDDNDGRRLHIVAISEVASFANGDTHRAEVSGACRVYDADRNAARLVWLSFDLETRSR